MSKAHLAVVVAGVCGGSLASSAMANAIVNGDFSAGNSGFTTGYTVDSGAGGGQLGAQYTGIVTNSRTWHSSFTEFGDHTTGSGNMMIFNGATTADVTLWQQNVSVQAGTRYKLEFWARSAYPDNPATIAITANINALSSTFSLPSNTGAWHKFSMEFVANTDPTTVRLVDTVLAPGGNDFAIDDISLTVVVPLPPAAWAGLGSLACVAGFGVIRRRRMAAN